MRRRKVGERKILNWNYCGPALRASRRRQGGWQQLARVGRPKWGGAAEIKSVLDSETGVLGSNSQKELTYSRQKTPDSAANTHGGK